MSCSTVFQSYKGNGRMIIKSIKQSSEVLFLLYFFGYKTDIFPSKTIPKI